MGCSAQPHLAPPTVPPQWPQVREQSPLSSATSLCTPWLWPSSPWCHTCSRVMPPARSGCRPGRSPVTGLRPAWQVPPHWARSPRQVRGASLSIMRRCRRCCGGIGRRSLAHWPRHSHSLARPPARPQSHRCRPGRPAWPCVSPHTSPSSPLRWCWPPAMWCLFPSACTATPSTSPCCSHGASCRGRMRRCSACTPATAQGTRRRSRSTPSPWPCWRSPGRPSQVRGCGRCCECREISLARCRL